VIYIRVNWNHQHTDEPVILLSELDENRLEVRKIEVFRDGRCGFAAAEESRAGTRLGIEPVPSLSEIALDPQFEPFEISKDAFETAWSNRLRAEDLHKLTLL
jgi:hypothetical protein